LAINHLSTPPHRPAKQGNLKFWSQVPATFSSGSKSSVWILPQPNCQILTQSLSRVLTIFLDKLTISAAASFQFPQALHYSSTPTTFHHMLCLQSRFQFNIHYLSK
ncbi:hypothetical protein ILYODFUR_032323, partial [Ilyodon furcidens]